MTQSQFSFEPVKRITQAQKDGLIQAHMDAAELKDPTPATLSLFKSAKRPTGKVGAVLGRLLETSPCHPLIPLDLAKHPERYGTDVRRNLRHAGKWLWLNTDLCVLTKHVPGESYREYWVAKR